MLLILMNNKMPHGSPDSLAYYVNIIVAIILRVYHINLLLHCVLLNINTFNDCSCLMVLVFFYVYVFLYFLCCLAGKIISSCGIKISTDLKLTVQAFGVKTPCKTPSSFVSKWAEIGVKGATQLKLTDLHTIH